MRGQKLRGVESRWGGGIFVKSIKANYRLLEVSLVHVRSLVGWFVGRSISLSVLKQGGSHQIDVFDRIDVLLQFCLF